MDNNESFSFRLPKADLDELERMAAEEERTVADILRRMIRRFLKER